MSRTKPNIVVTGTPGVGKTSLCESLVGDTGLQHLSINRIAKERECHDGWDEEMDSWIIDEDKVRRSRTTLPHPLHEHRLKLHGLRWRNNSFSTPSKTKLNLAAA